MSNWCDAWNIKWCRFLVRQHSGWPLSPSDGHFLLIVPLKVVLITCLEGYRFNPTCHLTTVICVLVASCSRGTKSVAVDAESATSSPLPSLLSTPMYTRQSHSLYLLRSACQSKSGIISVMELLAFVAAAAASSSAPQAARPPQRRGWVTLGRNGIWKPGAAVASSGSRGSQRPGTFPPLRSLTFRLRRRASAIANGFNRS